MSRLRLFIISFIITFFTVATLCFLTHQPLIFLPVNYSIGAFIEYAILVMILCFCLVFINLPLVKFLSSLFRKTNNIIFYLITTFFVLQIVSIMVGYFESGLTTKTADPFYYYKGVGNSLIYILVGNLTAVVTCIFYVKDQIVRTREKEINFDFDSKSSNQNN